MLHKSCRSNTFTECTPSSYRRRKSGLYNSCSSVGGCCGSSVPAVMPRRTRLEGRLAQNASGRSDPYSTGT